MKERYDKEQVVDQIVQGYDIEGDKAEGVLNRLIMTGELEEDEDGKLDKREVDKVLDNLSKIDSAWS